jgi:hypothetical protein
MRNRWRLWLGIFLLALFVIGGFTAYCLYDPSPIRYANFEQIQNGMTRADVEVLLGCPAGDYSTGPVEFEFGFGDGQSFHLEQTCLPELGDMQGGTWVQWFGDRGSINVSFDDDGKVQRKNRHIGRRVRPAWMRWLEQKLGR